MADALDRITPTGGSGDALDRIAVSPTPKTRSFNPPRLNGDTDPNALGDSLVGTLATDAASIPGSVVMAAPRAIAAMRHPIESFVAAGKGIAQIPADLMQDLRDGKYGKLGARALEMIIPGLGGEKAAEIAAGIDAGASKMAGRIASSPLPEAVGSEVGQWLTPGIVKRIRDRLKPVPAEAPVPQSPEPFRPNPNIARRSRYGGPADPNYSAPSTSKRITGTPAAGLGPLTPQGQADAATAAVTPDVKTPQAPSPFRPNPNIARKSRYGGPNDPDYSPAPSRAPSPKGKLSAPDDSISPVVSVGDAAKISAWLKTGGIDSSALGSMDVGDWQLAAHGAGVKPPSPGTIKLVMDQMKTATTTGTRGPVPVRRRKAGQ